MYRTDGYPIMQYTALSAIALENSTPVKETTAIDLAIPIVPETAHVFSFISTQVGGTGVNLGEAMGFGLSLGQPPNILGNGYDFLGLRNP